MSTLSEARVPNVGPQPESPPEALPARFSGSGRSYLSYQLAWWPLTVHGHLWVWSQAPRSRADEVKARLVTGDAAGRLACE